MKHVITAAMFSAVVLAAAPAALACEGHATGAAGEAEAKADNKSNSKTTDASKATESKTEKKTDAKDNIKAVSVDDLQKQIDQNTKDKKAVFIVDVNSAETRSKEGVIPGAWLIDSASEYDLSKLPTDKAAAIVFYCANEKCGASHTAAKKAIAAGYTNVATLPSGIAGWVKAKKNVEKPAANNAAAPAAPAAPAKK